MTVEDSPVVEETAETVAPGSVRESGTDTHEQIHEIVREALGPIDSKLDEILSRLDKGDEKTDETPEGESKRDETPDRGPWTHRGFSKASQ